MSKAQEEKDIKPEFLSPESIILDENEKQYYFPIKYKGFKQRRTEKTPTNYTLTTISKQHAKELFQSNVRSPRRRFDQTPQDKYNMADYQPLQFIIGGDVRFKKKTYKKCMIGVTPHYIFFVENHNSENQPHEVTGKYIGDIHVLEVKKLLFGKNYELYNFLQIKLNPIDQYKMKATIYNPEQSAIKKLTQLIYRNVQLAYANAPQGIPRPYFDQSLAKNANDDFFPDFRDFITHKLSLSQCFQFSYSAICSLEDVPYNHDVVNYFHNQLIASNGYFNVNWVPFETKDQDTGGKLVELRPIFRALLYSDHIKGIFCENVKIPEVFKAIAFQLMGSSQILFLHCVNVSNNWKKRIKQDDRISLTGKPGEKRGVNDVNLEFLIEKIRNNEEASVIYYDFSRNFFSDPVWLKFLEMFKPDSNAKCYKSQYGVNVIYLGFNECYLTKEIIYHLIDTINYSPPLQHLQYLHLAGSEWDGEQVSNFCTCLQNKFISPNTLSNAHTLRSLDLSSIEFIPSEPEFNIQFINRILHELLDQPIERLYLKDVTLFINKSQEHCFDHLIRLINKKPTFSTLDISNTGLLPEHVAEIVASMGSHHFYKLLTIKANHLRITGQGAKLVYSGFLKGKLDRWGKIFLDSNKMRQKDIQRLIPIFHQMNNLRELSLSNNLTTSMPNVELDICELLTIQSLKVLHLCGSKKRPLGSKLNTLFVAMALSYRLRNLIGGLAKYDRTKDQMEVFDPHMDDILSKLLRDKTSDEEREGYRKYIEEIRLEHISASFFLQDKIEEMTKIEYQNMRDNLEKVLKSMDPLLKAATGEKYKETNLRDNQDSIKRMNPIGYYSANLLNQWKSTLSEADKTDSFIRSMIGTGDPEDEKELPQEWFRWAGKLAHLEELDIRNNEIGDDGINCVNEFIKLDTELKGIEIDGSDATTVRSIFKIINTIADDENFEEETPDGDSDNEHSMITKMTFPMKDFNEILRKIGESNQSKNGNAGARIGTQLIEEQELQQRRLVQAQNRHIFERKFATTSCYREVAEYDFQEIPQISTVLNPKSQINSNEDRETSQRTLQKKLRIHSGISEDFRMQLPYLPMDREAGYVGIPDNYMLQSDEIIEAMKVYEPCEEVTQYKDESKHSNAIEKRFFEDDDLSIPDTAEINVGPIQVDPNAFDEELPNDDELLLNSDDMKELVELTKPTFHVSDKSDSQKDSSSESEKVDSEGNNDDDRVLPEFDSADHEPETINSMLYRRKKHRINFDEEKSYESDSFENNAKTEELSYRFDLSRVTKSGRMGRLLEPPPE